MAAMPAAANGRRQELRSSPSLDVHLNAAEVENYVFIEAVCNRNVTMFYDRNDKTFRCIDSASDLEEHVQTLKKDMVQKPVSTKYPHRRRISDVDLHLQWLCFGTEENKSAGGKEEQNEDEEGCCDPLAYFIADVETTDVILMTCSV